MPLYKKTLDKKSFKLLEYINSNQNFRHFYLAGGTSLSLQIGHRESIDLDFFTHWPFSSNLISKLNKPYDAIGIHNNSIEAIVEDTKVFFFYFAFPRYKDLIIINEIKFADPVDIGLMKLLALQGRTTRKDIIDLYFIDKEIIPLENLMELFQKHYPKERFNQIDSIKTLLDSETLELQPMPKMLKKVKWCEIRDYVVKKVIQGTTNTINLS